MINKHYKRFFIHLGRFFFLGILLIFLINLVAPDRSFSEKENRVLAHHPEFRVSRILSGKYSEKFETYANDQFFARDFWVEAKAVVDRVLGKVESNGVYLAKDGYLFEQFTPPREKQFEATTQAIREFSERHKELRQYALIAPNAVNILSEKLPANAPVTDQNPYLDELGATLNSSGIQWIDVRDTLRNHKDTQLYYFTDHHWTTQAAYYSYLTAAKTMNLDTSVCTYEALPASKTFQGTLSAKSGFRSSSVDEIDVFLPKNDESFSYVVNYLDDQTKTASFYTTEKLSSRDKYAMFFNGNHAQLSISNPSAEDRTLLVLKDSYANCFLPFLAPHYRTILVIDPRYYYGDLDSLIAAEEIQEVLYLYNANTFFSDNSLEMTLSTE